MRALDNRSRLESGKTLALVLEGGHGTRLHGLTRHRAKPAVPFGGQHRIVDYALSNCVNSGIADIAVLTQTRAQSLIRHLQRNWLGGGVAGIDSLEIWPAHSANGGGWYAGAADALQRNRNLIEAADPDNVLVVAGDHIYAMDYSSLMSAHAKSGADVTISCVEVPACESREHGIVEVDEHHRLRCFIDSPDWAAGCSRERGTVLAAMGVHVFSTDYLMAWLNAEARTRESGFDTGSRIVPRIVGDADIHVSVFRTRDGRPGYWRAVGTIDSYWLAHRDLLGARSRNTAGGWSLHGGPRVSEPARLEATATVRNSLLGADSDIAGAVDGTVVSTGCRVGRKSVVTDSVLLPGVTIGRNCIINRVVVDSRCEIPNNTILDARHIDATEEIYVSPHGVALVTAQALACLHEQKSLQTA